MRHAFLSIGDPEAGTSVLAGHTWTTFADADAWPNVTDFDGPPTGVWTMSSLTTSPPSRNHRHPARPASSGCGGSGATSWACSCSSATWMTTGSPLAVPATIVMPTWHPTVDVLGAPILTDEQATLIRTPYPGDPSRRILVKVQVRKVR